MGRILWGERAATQYPYPSTAQAPALAKPGKITVEEPRLHARGWCVTELAAISPGEQDQEDQRGGDDAQHKQAHEHDDEPCGL